jgi:hypothetical protein
MTIVLFVHSWLRWLVLLALVGRTGLAGARLAQGAPFEKVDRATSGATLGLVHLEILVGLVLYALSPLVRIAFGDMGAAMKDPTLRFFTVEHGSTMLIAGLLVTLAVALARRAADDRRRHQLALAGFGLALLLIVAMIPWPFRQVARPWVLLP